MTFSESKHKIKFHLGRHVSAKGMKFNRTYRVEVPTHQLSSVPGLSTGFLKQTWKVDTGGAGGRLCLI